MTDPTRLPRRIVEAAMFEGEIGAITARELIAMPEMEWGMLRDRITDFRQGRPKGLLARCMMCGDSVFISARKIGGRPLPLFSHFQGGGMGCAWHYGSTRRPDQIRAAQYHGRQESQAHRLLCEQIERLAKLDERFVKSTVNSYRPPTESEYGRFPDVAVVWHGLPDLIFEVQLSKTFQTEISARCTHYEREQAALLWILHGFDPNVGEMPQSFVDVIRRQRGNAFMIDRDSVAASYQQRTLVLKCFLQREDGSFDAPRLVRLDNLIFPNDSLPYVEDRITKVLLERIELARRPCFAYLKTIEGISHGVEIDSKHRQTILAYLRRLAPVLSNWADAEGDSENAVLRLVAAVFSVIATANERPKIYGTRHENVSAMLNTWLNTRSDFQRYALIIEHLLKRTPLIHLLSGTVGQHIARAKAAMEGNLCLDDEPEWRTMRQLVPEIFDPLIRSELRYLGVLPRWASEISSGTTPKS